MTSANVKELIFDSDEIYAYRDDAGVENYSP
jgi:hypothetical protein